MRGAWDEEVLCRNLDLATLETMGRGSQGPARFRGARDGFKDTPVLKKGGSGEEVCVTNYVVLDGACYDLRLMTAHPGAT